MEVAATTNNNGNLEKLTLSGSLSSDKKIMVTNDEDEDVDPSSSDAQSSSTGVVEESVTTRPTAAPEASKVLFVGGPTEEAAFCLLDGFVDDPSNGRVPFRLPINRLPASLGRTHVPTENAQNFFGLGKTVKALSRLQCKIEYRNKQGTIEPLEDPSLNSTPKLETSKLTKLYNPSKVKDLDEEETGYFVVTCLGKNPIKVNGQKVEQHESCILVHGSAIKISAFSLYFLLPEESDDEELRTLELPAPTSPDGTTVPNKKRSRIAMETGSSSNVVEPVTSSSSAAASSTGGGGQKKQGRGNAWTSIQEQLDAMSTDDLLSQLSAALDRGIWDRRCQFMGATVAYRAVREAAWDPDIQQKAAEGGVSKAEVVEWIHSSERFMDWASIMKIKLEPKSYQSSISKAMTRAGYERINNKNFGRHVRWYLPANIHDNPNREEIERNSRKKKMDKEGNNEKEADDEEEEDGAENEERNEDVENEQELGDGQEDEDGSEGEDVDNNEEGSGDEGADDDVADHDDEEEEEDAKGENKDAMEKEETTWMDQEDNDDEVVDDDENANGHEDIDEEGDTSNQDDDDAINKTEKMDT